MNGSRYWSGTSILSLVGNAPENDPADWSYLHTPEDFQSDMRWSSFPLSIIRGLVLWLLGKDPVAERRQRQIDEEQVRSAARLEEAERDAYRHIGEGNHRS